MLNSGYGAVANTHFLYYKIENAEAITKTGQLVNKFTTKRIETFLQNLFKTDKNYWLFGDTDSAGFTLNDFASTLKGMTDDEKVGHVDNFSKEIIEPEIESVSSNLTKYMNCPESRLVWERETIASKSIFVAKKKYIMKVLDKEGKRFTSDDPDWKIKGTESIKSSTPEWARDMLTQCYKAAIEHDEATLQKMVKDFSSDFERFDVNSIATPSGVNNIEKYLGRDKLYIKGTPKHVRASIIHNKLLDDLSIKSINKIQSGNKIKYISLKKPNPIGYDVVAFDTYLPKEFNLDKYVDRDEIYEKSFLSPLRIFLESIDWTEEEQVDLFNF